MRRTFTAWLLLLGGLGIEIAVDRYLRIHGRDFTGGGITTGMPKEFWYGIQMLLALGAAVLAWLGTAGFSAIWKRLIIISVEMAVGFALYILVVVWYQEASGAIHS